MVTLEPPELVTVSLSIWLPESWMLPKFRLEGLVPRKLGVAGETGTGVAPVPVPAREIAEVSKRHQLRLPYRVEITYILPLAAPADSGVKVAAKPTLCPGVSVSGKFGPL